MGTTVRPLTDGERGELGPLLRELHTHVEGCDACKTLPVDAAADYGWQGMCGAGAALYRRWLAFLARGA